MEVPKTPNLPADKAIDLLKNHYGFQVLNLKELNSFDDRNYFFNADSISDNSNIDTLCNHGYILKITNSLDSKDEDVIDGQNRMMLFLSQRGVNVPVPVMNKSGAFYASETLFDGDNNRYAIRVLTFLPGKTLYEVEVWSPDFFYQCGSFLAKMDRTLKDFYHPSYDSRNSIWYLTSVPKLKNFMSGVKDEESKRLVLEIVDEFEKTVMPRLSELETGIIHGDFNEQNILVNEDRITGVIDFGDTQKNALIFELAIAIMYMMTKCTVIHPNFAGGHLLAGYIKERSISDIEMNILKVCVAARYAQSLTMGAYHFQKDPSNPYVLASSKNGWKILSEFWNEPKNRLMNQWLEIIDSYKI